MITSLSILISLICLGSAWFVGFYTLRFSQQNWDNRLILLGIAGLCAEAIVLYGHLSPGQANNFGFFNGLAFTTWLISIPCLFVSQRQQTLLLPLFSLPWTIVTLAMMLLWGTSSNLSEHPWGAGITVHVVFSISAYTILALAAIQAFLLLLSQRWLHQRQLALWRFRLPPIERQESWLFALIATGWLLLTTALISGFVFVEDLFAQHLAHKTLFSCAAWAIFAGLLLGRIKFGWRGKTAIYFTFIGFVILLVGYFGSQFVLEVLLQRR